MCRSSFSTPAVDRRFPHRLKDLSWEQRLRAGRKASSWESVIPHTSKSSPCMVAATFSSRTWRSSGRKSVMVTPLRSRLFSWLISGLWYRWVKSDSVSQHLVLDRLSKGDFRHLGRNQTITSWEPGARLCTGDRQMVSTGLSFIWLTIEGQYADLPSLILVWGLSTSLRYWVTSQYLKHTLPSPIKLSTTYSTSFWGWMKIMESQEHAMRRSRESLHQVWTSLNISAGRWDLKIVSGTALLSPTLSYRSCISGQVRL